MTIIYSCIARGTTILCSYGVQTSNSNYEGAVELILPQIPTRNNGKTTVNAANTKFHCIVENGIIFLCAAKPGTETRPCFAYLTEIKDQFHNQNFAEQAITARTHDFDSQFNSVISKQMDKYSKTNASDNLTLLQGQAKEVQGIMSKKISENAIKIRKELDGLKNRIDDLEAPETLGQRTTKVNRKKYWWNYLKMKIIVGLVVFAIILGIVLAIVVPVSWIKEAASCALCRLQTYNGIDQGDPNLHSGISIMI